ncbi:MAG: hypothetical protein H0X33_08510 [Taibaiella sp.]|nr:hypothetical protein [Taibaiella sp.]
MTLFSQKSGDNKWPLAICIAGFILSVIAYYPGFMSPDSFDQYTQATTNHYGDWHPPIMAAVWRVLNKVYKGPLMMMLLQQAMLWCSCYQLLSTFRSFLWRLLVLLFVLSPFVQNYAGYIIKDVQMAFACLLVFAILFRVHFIDARLSVVKGLLCIILITYAIWLRQNALPAVLPLLYFFSYLLVRNKLHLRLFVFVALTAGLYSLQFPFNKKIVHAEKEYPEFTIYLQDITGVYHETGDAYYPASMYAKGTDTARLRTRYSPITFDTLAYTNNGEEIFATNEQTIKELRNSWLKCISAHPFVYLHNRYIGFLYFLRVRNGSPFVYWYPRIDPNPYGFVYHKNVWSDKVLSYIHSQGGMVYMRPWFWLLLGIVLLGAIPLVKDVFLRFAYVVLVSSSLLYLLPQFFIFQTDTDFRYVYWNCIAEALAFCLLLIAVFNKKALVSN